MTKNATAQSDDLRKYFKTPKQREFFAGEELVAYDVDQLLKFEIALAGTGFGKRNGGKPPVSILVHLWFKARDSWERVMLALPAGCPERDEMAYFLAERDEAMNRLREKASAQLARKLETPEGQREFEALKAELQRDKAQRIMESTAIEVGEIIAEGEINGNG